MRFTSVVLTALLVAPLAAAQPKKPSKPAPAPASANTEATLRDITQTLGFVPVMFRAMPPSLLPGAWQTMKSVQLSNETKLDSKTKELIGLAVAAQIPCDYCVEFHTAAARKHGASDQEIQEAVAMAAVTRELSTVLNGNLVDKAQFRADLQRIMAKSRQAQR